MKNIPITPAATETTNTVFASDPTNRLRNTRKFVRAILSNRFGEKMLEKNKPFAHAFQKALNKLPLYQRHIKEG